MAPPLSGLFEGLSGGRWLAACIALVVLAGLNNGYNIQVGAFVQARLNESYPDESHPLHLADSAYAFLGSSFLVGMVIGAGTSGPLLGCLGARDSAILGELIAIIALFFGVFAAHSWMVLVWRLLVGIANGVCITAKPLYIAESAPIEWKGRLMALLFLCLLASQVAAELVDWLALPDSSEGSSVWRTNIAIGGIFPVALGVLLYLMPQSPRNNGVDEIDSASGDGKPKSNGIEAKSHRKRIRRKRSPQENTPLQPAKADVLNGGADEGSLVRCVLREDVLRSLGLCALLAVAKEGMGWAPLAAYQFSILVSYYTESGEQEMEASDSAHKDDMIVYAFVVLGAVVCLLLIDRPPIGRRGMVLVGCAGGVLGVVFIAGAARYNIMLLPYALCTTGFFNALVQGAYYAATTEAIPFDVRPMLIGPVYASTQLFAFGITEAVPYASNLSGLFILLGIAVTICGLTLFFVMRETSWWATSSQASNAAGG